jgi:TRAP-type C4-dicarboxylate transport system permease small subunit
MGKFSQLHLGKTLSSSIEGISTANSWLHTVGAMSLLVLAGLVVVNVILRYAFRMPLSWIFEVSLLFFMLSIFLCWGFTTYLREHVQVTFVLDRLPTRIQTILKTIYSILGIFVFIMIVWGGVLFTLRSLGLGEVTDFLHIPFYPFKALISLGALFVLFVLLVQLARRDI